MALVDAEWAKVTPKSQAQTWMPAPRFGFCVAFAVDGSMLFNTFQLKEN